MSRRAAPAAPERDVLKATLAVLESRGCLAFRRNVAAVAVADRFFRCGEPGQSDIWGVLPPPSGAHFECEVKRRGKRPTLDQIQWLIRVNGFGRAVAWWSDDAGTAGRVLDAVLAGARVVYRPGTEVYSVKVGGKAARVVGPCADYDVVFPGGDGA
jgi:hypothetical protein